MVLNVIRSILLVIFIYTGVRDLVVGRLILAGFELWMAGFLSYDLLDEIWRMR